MEDKHTFIGKRKVCSTDPCDFTDYQGIGSDPMYRRYESVRSIVGHVIDPAFTHFLAAPDYSTEEDVINWYIDDWTETPERLADMTGDKRTRFAAVRDATLAHYRAALDSLSGDELQIMLGALVSAGDDELTFGCDGKVFTVAWGMRVDTSKHPITGEVIHESPYRVKHDVTFDPGEHGRIASPLGGKIALEEGAEITQNDIPTVEADSGYEFTGWQPAPIGAKVTGDLLFTAAYRVEIPPLPAPDPVPVPEPQDAVCRFNAGLHGSLRGEGILTRPLGYVLTPADIPQVMPEKGWTFKGWSANPLNVCLNGDMNFEAVYEKKQPWYTRLWNSWLKWLLLALLALLLLLLLSWLFPNCRGCTHTVNGVADLDRVVTATGDTIDNNGYVKPIPLNDGKLPDGEAIVAPIRGEDGKAPNIIRNPGVPPVMANRLFLFLEDESDSVDALADDFKKAYPDDNYSIVGYDRDVKSLVIQIPENER
ncbi:MAG TPA: peptidase S8, partial [Porphyromonadaceae bacterium]|nr:peptidase S8 [Porphyromonadaceae bacterium]